MDEDRTWLSVQFAWAPVQLFLFMSCYTIQFLSNAMNRNAALSLILGNYSGER